jgi:hypothetical protein
MGELTNRSIGLNDLYILASKKNPNELNGALSKNNMERKIFTTS